MADALSLEQMIGRIIQTRPTQSDELAPNRLHRNALENWAAATWGELEKLEKELRRLGFEQSALQQQLEQLERVGEELERARGILRAAVLGADRELEQLGLDVVRPS